MKFNLFLFLAEAIIEYFWNSPRVKEFVIHLLTKYAKSTDNDVDDLLVSVIKSKLIPNNTK